MRLFDDDKIGCYLDAIGHRVQKTKGGDDIKMLDLTLRVQPFTPQMAAALDADVRALLFTLGDGTPKPKIKAMEFKLAVPHQLLTVHLLPEMDTPQIAFTDVEISDPRARTEKGVDGYALVVYASFGPVGAADLEYAQAWLTEQRFVTFHPMQPGLGFGDQDGTTTTSGEAAQTARQPRRHPRAVPPAESAEAQG